MTKRVVDAVEDKVDDMTEAVESTVRSAGSKIRDVAGRGDKN
ncbi:hypothetical protein JOD62_000104 [Microbacterium keratanolyticum]|nr:hypothetical protein [Microbacterium keratanolyticum]MBM7467556.1 hypothetical protein [Microbacterium keratanolyticum]